MIIVNKNDIQTTFDEELEDQYTSSGILLLPLMIDGWGVHVSDSTVQKLLVALNRWDNRTYDVRTDGTVVNRSCLRTQRS